ncbi:MAG: beta-ketoacyl synthase N-terminal-like domain-containing protein [Vicinamibacteria bacterium]
MTRLLITGLGVVSPIGQSLDAYWSALLRGASRFSAWDDVAGPAVCAGRVEPDDYPDLHPPSRSWPSVDKLSKLMCMAAAGALRDARLDAAWTADGQVGVAVASGFSTIDANAHFIRAALTDHPRFVSPTDFANATPNTPASQVAIHLGLRGVNATISSGASSGLRALEYAGDLLRQGHADAIVVGGCEQLSSFALRALDLARPSSVDAFRPFDRRRCGTVAAEGAACLVLERADHAVRRGAPVYAELVSEAQERCPAADADPRRAGSLVLQAAMRRALDRAGLALDAVDYVSASANGSVLGDAIELDALGALCAERDGTVNVGSIKSTLGETYGASGIFQVLAGCLALSRGQLPPEPALLEPDTASVRLVFQRRAARVPLRAMVVNAFEPQGPYASVVLGRCVEVGA